MSNYYLQGGLVCPSLIDLIKHKERKSGWELDCPLFKHHLSLA